MDSSDPAGTVLVARTWAVAGAGSILPRVGMLLISLVGGLVLLLHPSAHRLSQTPDDGPR